MDISSLGGQKKGRTLRKPGDQGLTQRLSASGPYSEWWCDQLYFSTKPLQPQGLNQKIENIFWHKPCRFKTLKFVQEKPGFSRPLDKWLIPTGHPREAEPEVLSAKSGAGAAEIEASV